LVRDCDRVYLLKQGQVRNSGGYAELVLRDPRFREVAGGAA
jgi:ABC-type multidrug transport system fused ATPase/permease subunit